MVCPGSKECQAARPLTRTPAPVHYRVRPTRRPRGRGGRHAMTVAKIVPLHDLARRLEAPRRAGLKIVQCHGCFDLLHIGHIRHLQAARAMGDLLLVTVTADVHVAKGEGRPAFTDALRAEALAALACVDFVAISPGPTAVEAIQLLRPDFYVKGQAGEEPARRSARLQGEIAAVRALGGDVRFTHEAVFSSTALLNAQFRVPGDGDSA
jgi:rfaE bifunctional protein nucleotidyltransferase chain/domain